MIFKFLGIIIELYRLRSRNFRVLHVVQMEEDYGRILLETNLFYDIRSRIFV